MSSTNAHIRENGSKESDYEQMEKHENEDMFEDENSHEEKQVEENNECDTFSQPSHSERSAVTPLIRANNNDSVGVSDTATIISEAEHESEQVFEEENSHKEEEGKLEEENHEYNTSSEPSHHPERTSATSLIRANKNNSVCVSDTAPNISVAEYECKNIFNDEKSQKQEQEKLEEDNSKCNTFSQPCRHSQRTAVTHLIRTNKNNSEYVSDTALNISVAEKEGENMAKDEKSQKQKEEKLEDNSKCNTYSRRKCTTAPCCHPKRTATHSIRAKERNSVGVSHHPERTTAASLIRANKNNSVRVSDTVPNVSEAKHENEEMFEVKKSHKEKKEKEKLEEENHESDNFRQPNLHPERTAVTRLIRASMNNAAGVSNAAQNISVAVEMSKSSVMLDSSKVSVAIDVSGTSVGVTSVTVETSTASGAMEAPNISEAGRAQISIVIAPPSSSMASQDTDTSPLPWKSASLAPHTSMYNRHVSSPNTASLAPHTSMVTDAPHTSMVADAPQTEAAQSNGEARISKAWTKAQPVMRAMESAVAMAHAAGTVPPLPPLGSVRHNAPPTANVLSPATQYSVTLIIHIMFRLVYYLLQMLRGRD